VPDEGAELVVVVSVVAELAALPAWGARLAAVIRTAKVPYAASSAIDLSI
jgi:hypothetical protein